MKNLKHIVYDFESLFRLDEINSFKKLRNKKFQDL